MRYLGSDDLSSMTAEPNEDDTFTLIFGCGGNAKNNLPIKNVTGVFSLTAPHYIPSNRVKNNGYRLLSFVKEHKKSSN